MNARTFAIIGIRLLAALSFIRTISAISLWAAEKNIAIGYKADIFGASYIVTVVALCAVPFVVGILAWIYAPKLATYFCRGTDEAGAPLSLSDGPNFLSMGLVAVGVLILINVLPLLIFNTLQLAFAHHSTTLAWESVVVPAIKIGLCLYVITRASKLSNLFFSR